MTQNKTSYYTKGQLCFAKLVESNYPNYSSITLNDNINNPYSPDNINFIPTGVEAGMFIAWLVNLDDRKITKPIARTLLKPFRDTKDTQNEQYFYWPSQIYTTGGQTNIIGMFKKTLTNYCIYKQKNLVKS